VQRAFNHSALAKLQNNISFAAKRVEASLLSVIGTSLSHIIEMDLVKLSRMACLDTFGLAAFGFDVGCTQGGSLSDSKVFRQTEFMQLEATRRCFHDRFNLAAQLYWIPTTANRQLESDNAGLRELLTDEIIQCRREELKAQEEVETKEDLLSSALKGSKGFSDLSDDFLSDWLVTSLFGGYDTTALGLAYTIFMLADSSSGFKLSALRLSLVQFSETHA
jgi:cytochrome P450